MKKEKVYLVDGSGFIFRAFHATPPNLTRPDGTPINAVMGFCNMLFKLIQENHAHNIIVVFDAARKNFRNDICILYKYHGDERRYCLANSKLAPSNYC